MKQPKTHHPLPVRLLDQSEKPGGYWSPVVTASQHELHLFIKSKHVEAIVKHATASSQEVRRFWVLVLIACVFFRRKSAKHALRKPANILLLHLSAVFRSLKRWCRCLRCWKLLFLKTWARSQGINPEFKPSSYSQVCKESTTCVHSKGEMTYDKLQENSR